MISRIGLALLYSVAPAALVAQAVELRSGDGFINVEGEIVGYNGVMVQVETSVGVVAVPASEVICYGAGCDTVVASGDFGLTSGAFAGVEGAAATEAVVTPSTSNAFTVGFSASEYAELYRIVTGAYAVTNASATNVELTSEGDLLLQNSDTGQSASLAVNADDTAPDITVGTVSLNGTAPAEYNTPAAWALGTNLSHQLLGLNTFSVIVAPNAGISEISLDDLARIFAGEITNWSEIGGADMGVLPLQLPPNSQVGAGMQRLVMEPAGKEIAENVLTLSNEAGVAASINQFPGSVSVITTAAANADVVVDVTGTCGIAVAPTPFNIISGDYPLVGPIMATYDVPAATPLIAEVFDFASSDVARGLLENEGFINHGAMVMDEDAKNARLSDLLSGSFDDAQRTAAAEMFQALVDADRLSSTMTGGVASGPEGAWNRAMMINLIETLQDDANNGREIVFVGHGQSAAGSAAAIDASAAAATVFAAIFESVAADTIAAGGYSVSSYGFGDVSPAACLDGQVAGSDYTRIEVWLR
ncbi:periplasmic binding family protein [Yoonia maricola]|uniref:Periplasmic binding family protein n=1 Tax=Yoonia maricola TaxID=420999 RepID=A0A2M8WQK8_9RHOB|nr:substrate-binding domain-containing protein [Yoonia maricola]PJI93126.1 periplasmic binding family protein [Yoonia maricola]